MNAVEVASAEIDDPGWLRRCRRFAAKVLDIRGIHRWELSILLTDDETIRGLNKRYRAVDTPTDVLSFSQETDPNAPGNIPAGDIVISMETMSRNARERLIHEEEELKRLLIHGILHLEGLDHEDEDSEMIKLQESILVDLKKERIF
ncbi:MAG: rRNA maturation RNase YbeY [Spirochaetaceae bacterium]|nr:MAG: rRNA maturation RNase YbeY [Spirochaetaceae bacterium]